MTFKEQVIDDLNWTEKIVDGVENGQIMGPLSPVTAGVELEF